MTTTITLSHTEAKALQTELDKAIEDLNLDTLQLIIDSHKIHVVRLNEDRANLSDVHNMD